MKNDKIIDEKEKINELKQINNGIRKKENEDAVVSDIKLIKDISVVFSNMDMKRSVIALAAVLFIIFMITLIIPNVQKQEYVDAYEVYLNDKPIGAMSDITGLQNMLESIYTECENLYGMEIARDIQLTYMPVRISDQFLCPSEYYENILRSNIDVDVTAWVIFVNNAPVIALEKREDAQWVLEQILLPYKNNDEDRFEIGFLESVEIRSEAINFDMVEDKDTALRIMLYGDDIDVRWHKVVSGESLYSIGKSYDLKLSDIRKANPSLSESTKIYPGDKLIVTKIYNIVNVTYTEFQSRLEEMPYETMVIEDDTMYETQKQVQQEGMTGLREITANVVFINGSESYYEVLTAQTPSREPTMEVVVQGTKPLPNVLKLANSGDLPLPLKDYRITSDFGPRPDVDVEGASKFHNGVDLAAPYGTPIYASADGKVSFAGSSGGYGLLVKIKHDGGVETRYGHCSSILVKNGQYVKRGEVIALVGSTGTSSGNHVHFEVRINGKAVNPID